MKMIHLSTRVSAALVAVGCLLLSACASDGHLVTLQEGYADSTWKGHRIGEAFAKWGFPIMPPVHNADGTYTYRWLGQARYAYDQQTGHADTSYGTINLYEKRIGAGDCSVIITTDANRVITNLETTQQVRACTDSIFSTGMAPTAQNAADGKVLEQQAHDVRILDERFVKTCSDPEYADLLDESHCEMGLIGYTHINLKITPAQRKALLSWNKEMNALADDYKAFFLSTGKTGEVSFVRFSDSQDAPAKQDDATLLGEKLPTHLSMLVLHTSQRVTQMVQHSKSTYHQFGQ